MFYYNNLFSLAILSILALPIPLCIWNIIEFFRFLVTKKDMKYTRYVEFAAITLGIILTFIYICNYGYLTFSDYNEQIYTNQIHSIINRDTIPTLIVIFTLSLIGYLILRIRSAAKLPPLIAAASIASVYLGIGLMAIWCLQCLKVDTVPALAPGSMILIYIKTIINFILERQRADKDEVKQTKFKRLSKFLDKTADLPLIAAVIMLPILAIIIIILMLFGQAPDSVIKAWTDTADWTFSQKVAPQSISYDEHYLCTVAAGGHKRVVKPLRTGKRHGHRVMVNRQLCVANAFEQVLEEKTPRLHRAVRKLYDSTGYPIAKHIKSKYVADAIYFIMKPLEWLFLIVLYSVDTNPENRIAVQYPHSPVPKI